MLSTHSNVNASEPQECAAASIHRADERQEPLPWTLREARHPDRNRPTGALRFATALNRLSLPTNVAREWHET